jgi:hypothetical protein
MLLTFFSKSIVFRNWLLAVISSLVDSPGYAEPRVVVLWQRHRTHCSSSAARTGAVKTTRGTTRNLSRHEEYSQIRGYHLLRSTILVPSVELAASYHVVPSASGAQGVVVFYARPAVRV